MTLLPRLLGSYAPSASAVLRGDALIDAVADAGLRGRGGAGFPTAAKLRAVASAGGRRALVVNAAESEPMSAKDRVLLEREPHLVYEGAALAAEAAGAREIVLAAKAQTCAILPTDGGTGIRVQTVPDDYLAGEESALLNVLNGGPALPTLTPPYPSERGLSGQPTLVANVETLAHVALIARHGAQWFRAIGPDAHPGTALVTVAGAVTSPGVYELGLGTPAGVVLEQAGGTTERVRALLVGGYSGTWLPPEALARVRIDNGSLRHWNAALGAGVLIALPMSACPVAETVRVVRWMTDARAGQCGPCLHGLAAVADLVEALAAGTASADGLARLTRWCGQLQRRGACGHPDGLVRFLRSALDVFLAEFDDHRRYGPCPACDHRPVLRVPANRRRQAA